MAHSPGPITVSAGDEGGPLTNGALHTGEIVQGDLDVWTFTAGPGAKITLNVTQTSETDDFQPWIRLWSPTGASLGSTSGANGATLSNVVAPVAGTYLVLVSSFDSGVDGTGTYSLTSTQTGGGPARPAKSDFDGDGRSDAGIFRPSQVPNALWYAPQSGGGLFQIYFGASGDIPVPADYDGDGRADAVIFRPSTGLWYGPRTGAASIVIQMTLGQSGDIPVPCDYNGDGAVDPAIFRPSTGLWYGVKRDGSAVVLNTAFGQSGDVPVPADYDGDGKCDPGIFRGSVTPNGLWYAVLSGGGVFQIYFGASGDIPVPADYDGDGKADAAIFRPASGLWYGPRTGGSTIVIQLSLGQSGDLPIPADYDGDGATDAAIYRPGTGLFFGVRVQNGAVVLNTNFGHGSGDVPTTRRPGYPGVYPY
jgi:putative transposon-encoded protein